MTDPPSRPVLRNAGLILALLPLNALIAGYAFLAVGMEGWAAGKNGEAPEPPVAELLVCAGLTTGIGVALWPARARGAALFQVVPLLFLALLA
ncbi:hypothetical protein E2C00_23310 [Streptomyces sp. WAC05374]|uniref:hypothetical protein n=1 Tax=Streptomyces sp. WAC05374 TaxID=2487420 RepID=UPI000F88805E|nr:hypothetical protein [Streptomyces sp. WAC05374]RST11186.1 hypothetical protein EF905_25690 [Streptomyces sp. WAC05374]TDF46177.1 hypothetical protein E2B92_12315 [Streptomyces sp. WAC05374]TDF52423.1 hypothetical protein E2C00_23310 [Streptomyces sp. WAC05374]TDF58384.1 hypothetical protein E2C02_07700 [Streptomyces sp. WAC05374]